jgi:hypothetical protein
MGTPYADIALANAHWTVAQHAANGFFLNNASVGPECQHTRHRLRDRPGQLVSIVWS